MCYEGRKKRSEFKQRADRSSKKIFIIVSCILRSDERVIITGGMTRRLE